MADEGVKEDDDSSEVEATADDGSNSDDDEEGCIELQLAPEVPGNEVIVVGCG